MKKIIFTGFLIILATGAFGLSYSVGAQIGGGLDSYTNKLDIEPDWYIEANFLDFLVGFGVFFDAT